MQPICWVFSADEAGVDKPRLQTNPPSRTPHWKNVLHVHDCGSRRAREYWLNGWGSWPNLGTLGQSKSIVGIFFPGNVSRLTDCRSWRPDRFHKYQQRWSHSISYSATVTPPVFCPIYILSLACDNMFYEADLSENALREHLYMDQPWCSHRVRVTGSQWCHQLASH